MAGKIEEQMNLDATRLVAMYGALVSTIAVAWNVHRDYKDRARIELSATIGYLAKFGDRDCVVTRAYMIEHRPEIVGRMPSLFLTITNTGRRPLFVEGWTIRTSIKKTGDDHFLYPLFTLPKMLKEGEYTIEKTDDLSLLDDGAKRIYVWDSTKKHWPLSRRQLRNLIKDAKRVVSEE
jgi:hypothetical protein